MAEFIDETAYLCGILNWSLCRAVMPGTLMLRGATTDMVMFDDNIGSLCVNVDNDRPRCVGTVDYVSGFLTFFDPAILCVAEEFRVTFIEPAEPIQRVILPNTPISARFAVLSERIDNS